MASSDVENKIKALKDWNSSQPHLPQDLDHKFLVRFLHSCYYDVEKTKNCLDTFFNLRSSAPDLFNKRDPLSKDIQNYFKIVNLSVYKISNNKNVWIWQLNDPGLENYDYVMDVRVFLISTDSWILTNDFLQEADVVIMDIKDISLKFITKFNISAARRLSKYHEEAMPIRLKEIHIVNAPPFVDKLHAVMRPFLKQEYNDMIHFHKPNSDTIFKYFNKEDVPNDFGGTAGTLADRMKVTVDQIMQHRDFYLNDNVWKSDESKRPKDSKKKNGAAAVTGTFRSLAID